MISIRTLQNRIGRLEDFHRDNKSFFFQSFDQLTAVKFLRCVDDNDLELLRNLHPDNFQSNKKLKKVKAIKFDQLVKLLFDKYENQINSLVISSKEFDDHQKFIEFAYNQPQYEKDKFLLNKKPNSLDSYLEQLN